MRIRKAEMEDMPLAGHIMSVSFQTAFADFVSPVTLETCAREGACIALLEGIFREGKMHFLIGENSGMLCWWESGETVEIAAIHTLPESWGTGLGHALLTEA